MTDSGAGTVLITGAASGIGTAIAREFAAADWVVYATDKDKAGLTSLAADGCRTRELDVTDQAHIDRVHANILDDHETLDCLVNNAGYGELGPLEEVDIEAVQAQFDVNVHGPLRLTQAVLPEMRDSGGRIINISSILGRVGHPGMGAYCGSKFALEGMSDALRRELSEFPVDVVLIQPAWVDTAFAKTSREHLARRETTDTYDRLYRVCAETPLLDGGPLAVSPAAVAERVLEAATVAEPKARYGVGWQSALLETAAYAPDSVVDGVFERLLDAALFFEQSTPND